MARKPANPNNPLTDLYTVKGIEELWNAAPKASSGRLANSYYQNLLRILLRQMVVARIKWEGLPKGVSSAYFEERLLYGQNLCLTDDKDGGLMVKSYAGSGALNAYSLYSRYNVWALNGLGHDNKELGELALCDPYLMRINAHQVIEYYADFLVEFDKSAKSVLRMQKTPAIIVVEESQKLTAINAMAQYDEGEPAIFTYKSKSVNGFDAKDITAMNFNVPYNGDKILIDKRATWNDCMTILGIDNVNQDKKERLVQDEVAGNNEQIEMFRNIELGPRKEFAKTANEMFGTNITVSWNTDIRETNDIDMSESAEDEYGDDR